MHRERADPYPTSSPSLSAQDLSFPFLQGLSLEDSKDNGPHIEPKEVSDDMRTVYSRSDKTKHIGKELQLRRNLQKQKSNRTKLNNKRKIQKLEKLIEELEGENDKLKRKIECCPQCSQNTPSHFLAYHPFHSNCDEEMMKRAGEVDSTSKRGSHGSVQFENIEFHAPFVGQEIDERAWVFAGATMIAMGSKCLEVDGTINVFKVLKETVDGLRRQVEKSDPNITLDFYLSKEQMQENHFMNEVGFDPFISKHQEQGFALEGIRVESVSDFQLTYDSKLTFGLKYETLLGAMEYIRENSWITS